MSSWEVAEGSSPRMRGTRTKLLRPSSRWGIIPADAGNTFPMVDPPSDTGDHPRGCGEHLPAVWSMMVAKGSSPRMRGTQAAFIYHGCPPGIIPADAGNTTQKTARVQTDRDHPRGCGEHRHRVHQRDQKRGSSPRMRGTRPEAPFRYGLPRIIPADAGNTGQAEQHE